MQRLSAAQPKEVYAGSKGEGEKETFFAADFDYVEGDSLEVQIAEPLPLAANEVHSAKPRALKSKPRPEGAC